jgi:hypothetical protein
VVPPQFGNLSHLQYLSLSNGNSDLRLSQSWSSNLYNLKYLDMSRVDLSNTFDWSTIYMNHMLKTLILSTRDLSNIPADPSHVNLTFLTKLDLSGNSFNTKLPNWLWNLTGLLDLSLQDSNFMETSLVTFPIWLR